MSFIDKRKSMSLSWRKNSMSQKRPFGGIWINWTRKDLQKKITVERSLTHILMRTLPMLADIRLILRPNER